MEGDVATEGGVAAEKVAAAAEAKGKEAGEKSRQLSWARNKKNKAELVAILRQVAGDANIEGQGDPYLTRTPTERKAKTRQVKETLKMMYYDSVKDKTCPEPYVLWGKIEAAVEVYKEAETQGEGEHTGSDDEEDGEVQQLVIDIFTKRQSWDLKLKAEREKGSAAVVAASAHRELGAKEAAEVAKAEKQKTAQMHYAATAGAGRSGVKRAERAGAPAEKQQHKKKNKQDVITLDDDPAAEGESASSEEEGEEKKGERKKRNSLGDALAESTKMLTAIAQRSSNTDASMALKQRELDIREKEAAARAEEAQALKAQSAAQTGLMTQMLQSMQQQQAAQQAQQAAQQQQQQDFMLKLLDRMGGGRGPNEYGL